MTWRASSAWFYTPDAEEGGDAGSDDAGWEMEDLELPLDMDIPMSPGGGGGEGVSSEVFIAPTVGVPAARRWTQKSAVPGEHAAAGRAIHLITCRCSRRHPPHSVCSPNHRPHRVCSPFHLPRGVPVLVTSSTTYGMLAASFAA